MTEQKEIAQLTQINTHLGGGGPIDPLKSGTRTNAATSIIKQVGNLAPQVGST